MADILLSGIAELAYHAEVLDRMDPGTPARIPIHARESTGIR